MERTISSAWSSSAATWSTTPERRPWVSAPPSSSALITSPVAAFTSGGPPRKMVPCPRTMTRLVAHRRHIGAAGRARAHDAGDLRDALRAHPRLVEEDAAEVVAVGEHLGLVRQVRPAAVDQIDARQAVLQRDLLRAQVLLHRHREVGAALHRGVVGDDHHLAARDAADAGDQPRAGRLAVVEAEGGQLADLQERRADIEQPLDPLARQQLAALDMPRASRRRPPRRRRRTRSRSVSSQSAVQLGSCGEGLRCGVGGRADRAWRSRHRPRPPAERENRQESRTCLAACVAALTESSPIAALFARELPPREVVGLAARRRAALRGRRGGRPALPAARRPADGACTKRATPGSWA